MKNDPFEQYMDNVDNQSKAFGGFIGYIWGWIFFLIKTIFQLVLLLIIKSIELIKHILNRNKTA